MPSSLSPPIFFCPVLFQAPNILSETATFRTMTYDDQTINSRGGPNGLVPEFCYVPIFTRDLNSIDMVTGIVHNVHLICVGR